MSSANWPIVLVEVVLVMGGTLAFAWWQLRSLRRDQEQTRREREAREQAERSGGGVSTRDPDQP
ncbi:MAG: hypothetical protein MUF03_01795 [Rubrivivax sp.]|nr:hypothetical protein [Rubrivivax sp.]